MLKGFNTVNGKYCCNVNLMAVVTLIVLSFNTASGKYCCNEDVFGVHWDEGMHVSIPQAVSTVATR